MEVYKEYVGGEKTCEEQYNELNELIIATPNLITAKTTAYNILMYHQIDDTRAIACYDSRCPAHLKPANLKNRQWAIDNGFIKIRVN